MKEEHEWHDGFPVLPRGMTVLPWLMWAVILSTVILALWAGKVYAEPMAVANVNGGQVVIMVYTDDCNLKDTVINLPKRATWTEGGKTFEGCVGVQPEAGVAMFYFDDKTVAIVPLQIFARATGA